MERTDSPAVVDRLAAAVRARLGDDVPDLRIDPVWNVVEVTVPPCPDGAVVAVAVTDATASCAAVRYAHHRARTLGLPLRVVHTWGRHTAEFTDRLLTSVLYDCLSTADAMGAEREILHDPDTGCALRALSRETRLLVVSSVPKPAGDRILGRTVLSLIGRTSCPLAVVIPSPADHQEWRWTVPGRVALPEHQPSGARWNHVGTAEA